MDSALSERLRGAAQAAEVDVAALAHLAWAMVAARSSARDDVVFGSAAHGEDAAFASVLPLRIRLDDADAREGARRAHEALSELARHADASMDLAQRCSAVEAPMPLFTSVLDYRRAGEVSAERAQDDAHAFVLTMEERADGSFGLAAWADLAAATPERVCAMLATALDALTTALEQAPDTALHALEVLPPDERRQVLETWNRAEAEAPAPRCVQALFEAQAARRPDAVAVVHGGEALSYAELNRRANRLAHRLIASGLRPDDRVAIYLERSAAMVVAILATLKAGGAYVPLDPAYPVDRLEYMLGDVAPHTVLTQAALRAGLPATAAQVVELGDGSELDGFDDANPDSAQLGLRPDHLAYVIYTSGSTGLPKGVMIEHRSLTTLIAALEEGYALREDDRLLQFAALSFDMSVEEYFGALCAGATLVLRDDEWIADPATFWRHCVEQRISVLNLPTAFWHQIADERGGDVPAGVRQIMIGGEKVNAEMVARWFQREGHRPRLINAYGPTEATVDATMCVVDGDASAQASIGAPILHTRIYLLDRHLQPVPAGAVGELYIGGPQVARGYLNRAQLTEERFLADPFAAGGRMYKTGDLGRWRADGAIDYLGRNDFQVKIRGFRIELGEIESRLAQYPGVREAVVDARESAAGDKRLIGYVEVEPGTSIEIEALRAHLAQTLPAYMVPVAYVTLERMPLTANGKLDRKALPEPGADAYPAREFEAPVGELETALAQLWAQTLKIERVGRQDHFFELGGHSLLAVTLLSRMRGALALEVSLKDLFARPVLADLAAHLHGRARNEQRAIPRAPREQALPLSYAQQRLWFFGQLDGGSEAYHIPWVARLSGPLDVPALQRALDRIVVRHEVLRTTFAREDGRTVQRIGAPELGFDLRVEDLRGAADAQVQARLDGEVAPAFDLERGPLVRGALLRTGEDEHALVVVMHHIVSDGWSMGVLTEELSALYAAYSAGGDDPLPPLPIQYADYAVWQRDWLEGEVLEKQSGYWRDALAGAPALLELPTDRPRPAQQSFAGAAEPIEFDESLTRALKLLAQRHGATLYMTVLAAWMATLAWLTGQDDVVVGTAVANRMRTEVEGLIGFFVNTQALRAKVGGDVAKFLQQVKERVLEAQDHQDLPFERVVEIVNPQRSLAYAPIFQVMLAWQNNDEGELILPGVKVAPAKVAHTTAKFDLGLDLAEIDGRIVGHLEFATALFDRATAQRYVGYLRRMLETMAADERAALEHADLLGADERRLLVSEWNRTGDEGAEAGSSACIHELFEIQAARAPDAVAVTWEDQELSYAELNRRANRLAHHLIGLGVRPDDRVAICVERGLEMVVAVLAVLKAGGAYVPLDPVYPPERIAYMLGDSTPVAVLTDAGARAALGDAADALPVFDLSADAALWRECSESNPDAAALGVNARHLAYIIYTSGSTGAPKGVMIEHANVVRLFERTAHWFDFDARDVWTLFHSFAFDFSVWEIWGALLYGGRLVVVPYPTSRSPDEFYRLLCEQRVTVLNQTPSAFNQLIAAQSVSEREHRLRQVVFGGEALELRSLAPWYQRNAADAPQLVNMYGITETTVHVTYHALQPEDLQRYQGRSPIGARIPDLRTYILDARRRPAPIGATGELYVGGAGVARGYLNRPELTEERFIADPFAPGERLYKTGDLGRWRSDGTIEYLGRNDFQVKIRGFRIELGEIEARLAQYPGMQEVAVLAREDRLGDKRLVAYFSAAASVDLDDLRRHLGETLPAYMVPAAYVAMPRMPLTANGKLDRKALPAPDAGAYPAREYEAPVGATETALAQIWAEVLKLERVGRNDNFFALGGHSLLLMTLIERMRRIGLKADVRVLFAAPTLQALALEVGAESLAPQIPPNRIPAGCERIEPHMLPLVALSQTEIDAIAAGVTGGAANIQDIYPLAPLQEGFLFHYLLESEGDVYLTWTLLESESRERIEQYAQALQHVVDRHDILRTAVVWDGLPEPVQVVWRRARVEIEEIELDPDAGSIEDQLAERFDPRHCRIDIRQAPMWKLFVARDERNGRWVLAELIHHMIDDHTTIEFVNQEIQALLDGRADALKPPKPFRDFVAQTRLGLSRDEHEAFFRELLGDVDEPTAPFGLIDVRGDGNRIAEADHDLDPALCARLRACARTAEVSPAALCHLAWALVLARASGREDVVFGTVMLGRMHEGAERGMGVYINTLPLRVRIDADGAREGVRRTHRLLTDLLRHEHAPLNLAQRCSAVRPPLPLFSSLMNYRHDVPADLDGAVGDAPVQAWNGMRFLRDGERTNYPFDLSINDRLDGSFDLQFQTSDLSISPQRVCAMLETALESLATALEQAPDTALHALDVLPPDERRQVLEVWNHAEIEPPTPRCVQALFEAQAARRPDAVAVVHGHEEIGYAELNRRANRLAHRLIASGLKPDDRVAIYMERSAAMVVAILATLKAGGAYVPLDPAYPADRLEYMLGDVAPHTVLTQRALRDALPVTTAQAIELDGADAGAGFDETNPDPAALGLRPDHLAYVIYTSGSTGLPKGVMIEHRSLAALVHALEQTYAVREDDRLLQFAALSFDMSVEEYFSALCAGAALVLRDDEWIADPATFWRHCAEQRVSILNLPTAFWHQIADERGGDVPAGVRQIMIGGEKVNAEMVARWFQRRGHRPKLINGYGPTEATVDATMCTVEADPATQTSIGPPIPHTRVYVLDRHLQPVPAGAVGELYIGGPQVARGYLNRPELTEERFLPDRFAAGGRMYKTGDLGRWRADGAIDYLGRNDFQVKIRGFRIELGEIESRLAQYPGVREAVVEAREAAAGDKRLVGYVEVEPGAAVDTEALRAHLAQTLPAYMVPVAYVTLERMPLTANGKLNRKALPAPEADAYPTREFEAPVGELETALAQLWAQTLKIERIGRRDHFFELGGHSLLAVTLLSRMRGALALEVSLKDLFAHPVLADLAAHLHGRARSEQRAIAPVARDVALPLSHAQQRLWFLGQLDGASEAYHMPMALRLRGELDIDALRRALDRIVARHEVLRTAFEREDGRTVQRIADPDIGLSLSAHDLRGADARALDARLEDEAARAFDLARGPLVRGQLLRTADDEHVLAITMHHIVSDGWSMAIFAEELSALYAAYRSGEDDPLPPLPIQYADYAVWQRQWLSGEVLAKQSDYWRDALAGAPALLELPTDRPRPAQQSFVGDAVPVELDPALTAALRKLAQRHGTTLFMTVLAAWTAVLARLSGQDDIVVGTAVANRTRPEIEPLIGFFVNTQAIRVRIGAGAESAAELLAQVKARVLEAQDHQDLPFEQVVEIVNPARNFAHAPIFQVMLAWQNLDEGELRLPGLDVSEIEAAYRIAKFDFGLDLSEVGDRVVGQLEYASALFDRASVERHLGYLRRTLEAMVADENLAVSSIGLVGADERARLLALGDGGAARSDLLPGFADLYSPVLAQARRTPDAVAAIEPGRAIDYRELSERAHGVAWRLRELGVRPRERVALLADRSIDSLIGALGILAAGAAYVPVDPGYPAERIAYVLGDAEATALLYADERYAEPARQAAQALHGRAFAVADTAPRADAPALDIGGDDTAYVIYTSGSTGLPKGVVVPHRGALNLVRGFIAGHDFAGQRLLMIPPLVFDASVGDVFPALSVGAALVLHPSPTDLDARELQRFCAEHRIGAIDAPAALWRRWTDGLIELRGAGTEPVLPDLRLMMFGGESVPMELVRRFSALTGGRVALSNHYGPTEASVCATMLTTYDGSDVHGGDAAGAELPIGRPLPGVRVYLLDDGLGLMPSGAAGELCIGGLGVADGYQGGSDKNAQRFLADPFADAPNARLYRTGDRARWNADGSLQFLGRGDFQVKIRGFRIELGEIEARLAECPGCAEVAVLAREDRPGDKRLVAYVRAAAEARIGIEDLRAYLSATLPEYMVPAAYVVLERMPLTVNGKIDRKALPAPQADAYVARPYLEPVGATETALAQLWAQVLKLDRVGRNDNFFELGGHSLLAVSLIERMRAAGLDVDVRALFAAPTLQALASAIDEAGGTASDAAAVPDNGIPDGCDAIDPSMLPLVSLSQADIDRIVAGVPGGAANVQDIYPLAPLQESLLFHHALGGRGDVFLSPTLYAVQRREDFDRYVDAVQTVIERHDVLRTALVWEGLSEPVQVVWRRAPLVVEEIELDPADGDIAEQLRERFDPVRYRLDLRKAPAWRWFVARDERNGRWVALELMHHTTSDHTSLQLVQEEVAAILAGRGDGLPEPVPFRRFIARTRRAGERAGHEAYFREMLGDIDATTVPFGLLDTHGDGARIVEAEFDLDDALGRRLRAAARAAGVAPATLCHLAWALLLARVCDRRDVVFGTVMFGRLSAGDGADRAMGPFINTVPLRLRIDGASVSEGVRLTHERLTELLRHEHAPIALAQSCSAVPSPQPLFTSLLNYRYQTAQAGGADESVVGGLRMLAGSERTNYPLTVSVDDSDDGRLGFSVQAEASADARRIGALYETALTVLAQALEQAPDTPLDRLDVVPASENERVLALSAGERVDYPTQACLHESFQAQAARTPDAPALSHAGERLSYAELNRRANRLAHRLIALGVKPDMRVGLCLPRGPESVIAALAVLKAGGAYVALDPAYPRERLAWMLEDSAARAVIGSADTRAALPETMSAAWLTPDDAGEAPEHDPDGAALGLNSAHLAYLIYTSGSTGAPKGVMIEHRNAVNFLSWAAGEFGADALARTLFSTSMNFDLSVFECFAPLSVGGCVEIVADALALRPDTPAGLLNTVPSALQAWLETGAIGSDARSVNVAGETLTRELAERLFAQTSVERLRNLYGPSETTTYSTWATMDRASGFAPHIGRPIANTRVYVLDARGRLAPQGAVGEICIAGAGVARGYLGQPALTAERFIDDPFVPGERMYKTGDLGRWRDDGMLEFHGRGDAQIKLRGFRIEPGEIETRLLAQAGVHEALATLREDAPGDRRLVAYFVGEADIEALRATLSAALPAYLLPSAFVRLERLPRTANGKLDRAALPAPDAQAYAARAYEAPQGATELALARIWERVLGHERVGRDDDFFALGGNSLLAMRMLSHAHRDGIALALADVFCRPSLAGLAASVRLPAPAPAPEPSDRSNEAMELPL
ncbi:amino acid adenylation domain-containing protein [Lysobacter sp. K5869]|uniref:non-ribosomal peptide synthetase n=1 Tax=Lysobacter sp. K5869 TaxID=2820808 RepID=UPI001C0637ED|nr:non-ribosomal peptide synthetase [Lysobacter sp. K5869]QWP77562.1 amino acid adenylation domain-containing protein [Lysobacter sp. K5869]